MPFKKGHTANPHGRPRVPEIQQLREALEKAKKANGDVSFLEHYCNLAYNNHQVAIALANKILPDLSKAEIQGALNTGIKLILTDNKCVVLGGDQTQ